VTSPIPAVMVAAVLLAAVLHAVWNSLAKAIDDQLVGFMLIDVTGMVVCLAAILVVAPPAVSSWPFIAASACLHVGYKLVLMRSYRLGDLSQVYPLARGVAPLLVAAFAAAFIGERLGPPQLAGVVLVSVGLASLALGGRGPTAGPIRGATAVGFPGRLRHPAIAFALGTGAFIAAYTVTDGLGVRHAGTALGYAAWLFLLDGIPIPIYALAARHGTLRAALRPAWGSGAAAGLLSLVAYGLVLWAQTRGALAAVAALRETSVIVAAAIGTVVLGERFGRLRVLAATLVACGIVLLNLS
jgi:drug/metabolite transporter (DMT)-like permease